jgi:hypothetical protein
MCILKEANAASTILCNFVYQEVSKAKQPVPVFIREIRRKAHYLSIQWS